MADPDILEGHSRSRIVSEDQFLVDLLYCLQRPLAVFRAATITAAAVLPFFAHRGSPADVLDFVFECRSHDFRCLLEATSASFSMISLSGFLT